VADFQKVARRDEIPEGQGKVIEIAGRTIAVFHSGGKFYATDNTCLHRGGPLGEGHVKETIVSCPWHLWGFDVTTGVCTVNEQFKLETFPVKVEGEEILVGI
jgi:NAD(P)H-dependent nitrite reductase small subunit